MKVSREKLIANVKDAIAKYEADYAKEVEDYIASFLGIQADIVLALQETIKSTKSAKEFKHLTFLKHSAYNDLVVSLNISMPRKPEPSSNLRYAQRALRQLEMCSEESVTIQNHDEFSQYI